MNEVEVFCRRVLGSGEAAEAASAQALSEEEGDRLATLRAALRCCRAQAASAGPNRGERCGEECDGLAAAVSTEMQRATAALPERQREALALRELLKLSHEQIALVIGLEAAAVAPLLARARLNLRHQRRGRTALDGGCTQRERALRALCCWQDSEPLSIDDDTWLFEHLRGCEGCRQAHAAMLEASACYRAWPENGMVRVRRLARAPADDAGASQPTDARAPRAAMH